MKLGNLINSARLGTKEHFPLILTVGAAIGTVSTAYLAGRASFKAADVIRAHEEVNPPSHIRKERLIDRTKLVWKLYIPTALSAATTITCVVGANRVEVKKTIAAQTAFAVSQRAYTEYRNKVIEEFGERKDQSIRDKVAAEEIKNNPPRDGIILGGSGSVLCCELFTGRYFNCDMETLKRSVNEINAKVLAHDYATFDDFYYLIGLDGTTGSGNLGWKSNRLLELEFSTVLTEKGIPCLAFDYNYTTTL